MTAETKTKNPLHLRLTHRQWIQETAELTRAEIRVLYYVKTLDPFGDRKLDLQVTQIAKDLGIAKGTVSKALKRLDSLSLIELTLNQVRVKVTASGRCFLEETSFPTGNTDEDEQSDEESDSVSQEKQSEPLGNLVSSRKQSEPLGNDGIYIDHARDQTIQTNSNFSHSKAEDENKNEKNFKQLEESTIDLSSSLQEEVKTLNQPTASVKGLFSSAPKDPFLNRRPKPNEGYQKPLELEAWEIASGEPDPDFWQWRTKHYFDQGGKWADSASSDAYSEFYNNRKRTTIALWKDYQTHLERQRSRIVQASIKEVKSERTLHESEFDAMDASKHKQLMFEYLDDKEAFLTVGWHQTWVQLMQKWKEKLMKNLEREYYER